jgi:hypothetical protein
MAVRVSLLSGSTGSGRIAHNLFTLLEATANQEKSEGEKPGAGGIHVTSFALAVDNFRVVDGHFFFNLNKKSLDRSIRRSNLSIYFEGGQKRAMIDNKHKNKPVLSYLEKKQRRAKAPQNTKTGEDSFFHILNLK